MWVVVSLAFNFVLLRFWGRTAVLEFFAGYVIAVPIKSILMAVGAVIYFVSCLDLIPDAVAALGLMGEVWVINSVATSNLRVISSFRNGEVSFR